MCLIVSCVLWKNQGQPPPVEDVVNAVKQMSAAPFMLLNIGL